MKTSVRANLTDYRWVGCFPEYFKKLEEMYGEIFVSSYQDLDVTDGKRHVYEISTKSGSPVAVFVAYGQNDFGIGELVI